MKTINILVIAIALSLTGCSTMRAFGTKATISAGNPMALEGGDEQCCGGQLNSEGTEVFVITRGEAGKPTALNGVTVTCETSNPPRVLVKTTDTQGRAHFQVRGPLACWVDFDGRTYPVTGAPEDKDTSPNQRYILFEVPK